MADTYLTILEVAERYGISHATVRRAWHSGAMPAPIRIGRRNVRWRLADLERYEKRILPMPRPKAVTTGVTTLEVNQ